MAKAEKTVSIRQIENGFVVRTTAYGGKGGYRETERFSPTDPLKAPAKAPAKPQSNALLKASKGILK